MKAGFATLMTVASMALAIPDAQAHVRAQVVIQTPPVAVFGFSYGDPFAFGHVHYGPVACSHGPLYYYPSYGVYAHYSPRYRYVRYARPYYLHRHQDHWYRGGGWSDNGRHRGHRSGHSYVDDRRHDRRYDRRDDRRDDRRGDKRGRYKVRGH